MVFLFSGIFFVGRDQNENYKIVVRVVVGGREREARERKGDVVEGMDVDDEEECRATVSSWANLGWSLGPGGERRLRKVAKIY